MDVGWSMHRSVGGIVWDAVKAADLDGYCRTEEYLDLHPEEDCEDVLTDFVFEDPENPEFCEGFEFVGPWHHETVSLREQCPDNLPAGDEQEIPSQVQPRSGWCTKAPQRRKPDV